MFFDGFVNDNRNGIHIYIMVMVMMVFDGFVNNTSNEMYIYIYIYIYINV